MNDEAAKNPPIKTLDEVESPDSPRGSLDGDPDLFETWDMGPPSPAPDLHGKPDDEAAELMVEWFFDNFEDPIESTPYDSEEGGYIYTKGGPCAAEFELRDAFGGSVSVTAMAAAAKEIAHDGFDWAPADNRMVPELPDDPVILAKQRLYQQIQNWCFEANDSTDPESVMLPFRLVDVALLLLEHCRLSRVVQPVELALSSNPPSISEGEPEHE